MVKKLAEMNELSFLYYQSPLGPLRIAGTDQYISEISFIEQESNVAHSANSYPVLHKCVEELIEYFNGERFSFEIPVKQEGTEFQRKVWAKLLDIPYGKTISYMTLAKRLGDPNCIRAAASSNGKNHVAIIVPCHRVIGSNQSLVGYAGGLWRKKWLLDHENKYANGLQTLF